MNLNFTALCLSREKMNHQNQFGTDKFDETAILLVQNSNHIYIGGYTFGNFAGDNVQAGNGDSFICRSDSSGNLAWKRQFGTTLWDGVLGMELCKDGSGDIFIIKFREE